MAPMARPRFSPRRCRNETIGSSRYAKKNAASSTVSVLRSDQSDRPNTLARPR
jgi:hypothetical protein